MTKSDLLDSLSCGRVHSLHVLSKCVIHSSILRHQWCFEVTFILKSIHNLCISPDVFHTFLPSCPINLKARAGWMTSLLSMEPTMQCFLSHTPYQRQIPNIKFLESTAIKLFIPYAAFSLTLSVSLAWFLCVWMGSDNISICLLSPWLGDPLLCHKYFLDRIHHGFQFGG